MFNRFANTFVKITGLIPYLLVLRTKVYYEDKKVQSRKIKGPAIVICNHTALFDFAICLFLFFGRTVRFQMAEVLFTKVPLKYFLKALGGIEVNRVSMDFGFMERSEQILNKGGCVGIFPESRLPLPTEERPLEFKRSCAQIALNSGVKIIPVYTNGSYFKKERARVIIGKPIDPLSLVDPNLSDRENVIKVTEYLRDNTIRLGKLLDERTSNK